MPSNAAPIASRGWDTPATVLEPRVILHPFCPHSAVPARLRTSRKDLRPFALKDLRCWHTCQVSGTRRTALVPNMPFPSFPEFPGSNSMLADPSRRQLVDCSTNAHQP